MSTNPANREASRETGQVIDPSGEYESEGEVRVKDKRRMTPEGEPADASGNEDPRQLSETSDETKSDTKSAIEEFQARLKESEEKRAEAERQVNDFADRFRKAQEQLKAETEEQRARMQRNFDQRLEAARSDVLSGLLDTLDNLKRAIAAAEKSENRGLDFDSLLEGVRATANMFESKMLSLGLVPVLSVGEEFNPDVHEAVETVSVAKDQDNQVIDEFQTGYRLGDRLLRPARVRVGRASDD